MLRHIKDVFQGKTTVFKKRSSKWPSLRKSFLEINNSCAACGGKDYLEVHHIIPFHEHPELELDTTNLITLCDKPGHANCHLEIGHLGNFKKENPDVRKDAAKTLKEKTKEQTP